METKICTSGRQVEGCGRDLTLDSFRRNANGALQAQCKDCWRRRARMKKNYPELLEKALEAACTGCGETKPATEFSHEEGSGGKLRAECKACVDQVYRKNYSDKIQEHNSAIGPKTEGEKTCPRCTRSLPITGFHVELRRSDGRSPRCRECCSEYSKERREKRGKLPKTCLRCEKEFIPEGREQICPPCRSKIACQR